MTQTGRFFDGTSYTEAQFAEFMNRIMSRPGVLYGVGNTLLVSQTATPGASVDVATGEAWLAGVWYQSTAVETIAIPAGHASLQRIDRIVVRIDWASNTFTLVRVAGTPATPAVAPAITAATDLSLAQVFIPPTVSVIYTLPATNGSYITDERNTSYCGWAATRIGCAFVEFDSTINCVNHRISSLGTPTAATDAATKGYCDTTFAGLASPAFSGTPTAVTAGVTTNTTQLATTAFVQLQTTSSIASDVLRASSDAELYTGVVFPGVVLKTLLVPPQYVAGSVFRVKVDIKVTAGGTGTAVIKNRAGVTLASWSTTSSTYATKSADLTITSPGDAFVCWVYGTNPATYNCYITNFRVYGTDATATKIWVNS